ncbi:30S ribosomal protein S4 [Candidatus Karelsulcia muelleri]
MARYIGPKKKLSIKFGLQQKRYTTGKGKPQIIKPQGITFNKSNYYLQLLEKQKIKYIYGILEKQFRQIFEKAYKKKGITGEILLQLCESRLDNVVYRLTFATTRPGARQLVTHRHIFVNGQIVNIPSFTLKAGDIISVKENVKDHISANYKLLKIKPLSPWLKLEQMTGMVKYLPRRDQITEHINERLVVELYSK